MELITSVFTGGTAWAAALIAGALALIATYLGGRKIGKTQEKAKADVAAAKVESQQVSAASEKQQQATKAAKDVTIENQSVSDNAARERLQQSKYNRP